MSKVVNLQKACAVGEAHTDDGRHYKVAVVGRERLMLQSRQTGQQTALTWDQLVDVANRAGLDLDGHLGGPDAA